MPSSSDTPCQSDGSPSMPIARSSQSRPPPKRIGGINGAFTVNWGANRHCLVADGRRFADAMSFTGVLGWFQPARQVVGLVNGLNRVLHEVGIPLTVLPGMEVDLEFRLIRKEGNGGILCYGHKGVPVG